MNISSSLLLFFFFNDTATTEIYTLSLHDALPICAEPPARRQRIGRRLYAEDVARAADRMKEPGLATGFQLPAEVRHEDRKSTRLNSSHANISYAVFCLKKKKNFNIQYKSEQM